MSFAAWSRTRIVAGLIGLFAAGFFYLVALSLIAELGRSDPAGNAMASGFAVIAQLLLWLAVAFVVGVACKEARAPAAVLIVNLMMVVLGATGSIAALSAMAEPSWVWITPALMPPLAILCAAFTAASGTAPGRHRRRVAFGFAAVAALLGLAPFLEMQRIEADRPRREAEAEQQREAFDRAERARAAAESEQLRALGANAPLERYMAFFPTSQGDQAREAVRRMPSRQADTIRLLDSGVELYRFELAQWDLADTPELCAAYRRRLDRALANPQTAPAELESQIDNLHWLLSGGCDLRLELTGLIPMVRARAAMAPGDYSARIENILRAAPPAPEPDEQNQQ